MTWLKVLLLLHLFLHTHDNSAANAFISKKHDDINRCVSTVDDPKINYNNRKTKWAIIALTRENRPELSIRNQALADKIKPFSSFYDITIIFFSENTFEPSTVLQWKKTFNGIGKVLTVNTADKGFELKERYGYKYMCKFFALDVYEYLRGYDFYVRCDTDCYIKQLNYDVFNWVVRNNVEYGYGLRKMEAHGPTKSTLPLWVQKYVNKCSLRPKSLMGQSLSVCFNFYNNFHIGSVHFFLRSDVQHFLKNVNNSGHILSDRWGDSTIQAYAVRLFMDSNNIKLLPNFSYVHGSHSDRIVSTFGDGSSSNVPQRLANYP